MLINGQTIIDILHAADIQVTGVLHVGAHDCEELPFYESLGLDRQDVVWLDAFLPKVEQGIARGIPNLYHATVSDKDDDDVIFHISNNIQSSSILSLGTHAHEHPDVVYVSDITQKSITIDTFFAANELAPFKYNFWNLDIQGAELLALSGAHQSLRGVKAIYLEVNEAELYKGCALIGDLDKFLATFGFTRALTLMTPHHWGDALYIYN